tara:strand:+ start:242 stop:397 length:156 start_codon:yes stop_codon:yes gene_type:complete
LREGSPGKPPLKALKSLMRAILAEAQASRHRRTDSVDASKKTRGENALATY